jgi:hypothetical protein
MLERTFTEEQDSSEDDTTPKSDEPEYVFEGFNIEFSEKVMLTSMAPQGSARSSAQSISQAFVLNPKAETHGEMTRRDFEQLNLRADRREALQSILSIAANSNIARYHWRDRGVAPAGYIKGMALVYARVYCKLKDGDAAAREMAKANTGNGSLDALAQYANEFNAAGMSNSAAGADTLRHLFVLLIGLGMRESSGNHCAGRDQGASNTAADTAEAGLFQTSYNARNASPLLSQLFQQYRANPSGFLDIFREGARCTNSDLQNHGTGDGQEFQRLSKECPAFAAEFTAVGLRNLRTHWGPINTKTAEIRPECDAMLRQVQDLVDASNLCPHLQA